MGHKGPLYALIKLSANEFLSAGSDGLLVLWNLNKEIQGRAIARIPAPVFCLEYLYEDKLILAGSMNGHMYIIDPETHTCSRNIDLQSGSIFSIKASGDRIFTATQNGVLFTLNKNFQIIDKLKLAEASLRCLQIVENESVLYCGSSDKNIYRLNSTLLKVGEIISTARHSVFSLAYDYTRSSLISGSRDAQLYIHRIDQGTRVTNQIAAHLNTINEILLREEKDLMFTASRDKSIKVWQLSSTTLLKVIDQKFDAHKNSVNKLLFFPERDLLISASDDSAIMAWQININPLS